MLHLTLLLYVFEYVVCEWVEIQPISKNTSDRRFYTSTTSTTTRAYEVSIRNPFINHSHTSNLDTHSTPSFESKNGTKANADEKISQNVKKEKAPIEHEQADDEEDDDDYEDIEDNDSPIGMNSFMDFLKSAQKTLLQYKMNTYRSKMSVLKHLKDVLTLNINEKIANFKLIDGNSEARTYKEEEHPMDYHSSEGALMTIGFLTFSVFLIKLVIKLVHLLKYKSQYYYGMNTVTTTTPATVVFLKRKGRMNDMEDDHITKIIEYTEYLKH